MKAEWVEHTDAATGRKYYRCPAEKEKALVFRSGSFSRRVYFRDSADNEDSTT